MYLFESWKQILFTLVPYFIRSGMWNIFNRDPLDKIDRMKTQAEHREMKARKKAWRSRVRSEAWLRFKKRFKNFFSNPFPKKKVDEDAPDSILVKMFKRDPYAKTNRRKAQAEKKEYRSQKKAYRRRMRNIAWQKFVNRITEFLAHPFAKKELTPDQKEIIYIKKLRRADLKIARQKWFFKFRKNPLKALFPRKKRRVEGGGYLYVYNMTRQERKDLAMRKRAQNRENLKKILSTSELRSKFVFGFLHSTGYFIIAFMLVYIIYQVVTIFVAASYHIPIVWYYYELKFPLYTYSPLYTRTAMVMIFGAGPIISLMIAFLFIRLFFSENRIIKRFQLFYLWGFICGANMFFGAYIAGFLTRTEFIYTSEWLFMSGIFDIEEIFFTILSFVMMLVIGRILTPLFLVSSGSITMITPENRQFFIFTQVVFPWLAGMLILFLITTPHYYLPLIIKTITPGLVLLPSLYLYDLLQYEDIHKSGVVQKNYFRWSIIIAVIAILFFYRVILSFGLKL